MADTSYVPIAGVRRRPAEKRSQLDHTRLTPAGQRLLDAASQLFYEYGIHAVGVDAIAEAAGTTKKTLYDRFGSKNVLVALYLQRRADRWQRFVLDYLAGRADANDGEDGVSAAATRSVLAVLDALAEWNATLNRGCAFINAFAEIGGADHPGEAVIRAEKKWTCELYARLLREAGFADGISAELGTQLAILQEGALTMWTAGGVPDAIGHARAAARQLLSTVPS
ncbi:TetR/AcrR family transcriptional regulator [Phytoactinopolyspora mesophila]|uniref:TetR family transcriptional regulator n=1 Tax=Phytoactinopolyspora mesophila TaxID=2650750 RepID=A0A7K3M9S8_9ACTN|nr:TetR/AcrR family transcriptional regulator [Phytoactinopolyspora mesophila]NDL60049.1 TetR family transcriptional regulator [Phytoactinopolyspora mesophila]